MAASIQLTKLLEFFPNNPDCLRAFTLVPYGGSSDNKAADDVSFGLIHGGQSGTVNFSCFASPSKVDTVEGDAMSVDSTSNQTEIKHDTPWGSCVSQNATLAFSYEVCHLNFPITTIASTTSGQFTLVAVGGLAKNLHLLLRNGLQSRFVQIGAEPITLPIYDIRVHSDNPSKKGDSIRWNVYILFGGADKIVHYWSCVIEVNKDSDPTFKIAARRRFIGHSGCIRSLSLHRNSSWQNQVFVSASDDGAVRLWQLTSTNDEVSSQDVFEHHSHDVLTVDFNNGFVFSGGKDANIVIVNLNSPKTKNQSYSPSTTRVVNNESVVRAVVASDDSTVVLTGGGDGCVRIFQRSEEQPGQPGGFNWTLASRYSVFQKAAVEKLAVGNNRLYLSSNNGSFAVYQIVPT